ncbi:MAG: flagellar hook-length control protein FliK [Arcobacteraceae bacterium]|nr:flagellar hook-length control protein FliK [Arcobacteraceae bacterium]
MTQELSLFDTLLSTNTNTTKPQGEGQTSKEGSSLFDNLLKSVQTSTTAQDSSTNKGDKNTSSVIELVKQQTVATNTNNSDITNQSTTNSKIVNNPSNIVTNENSDNKPTQTSNGSVTSSSNAIILNDSQKVKIETPTQQSSTISQATGVVEVNETEKLSVESETNIKPSPKKQLVDEEVVSKSKHEIKNESKILDDGEFKAYRTTSILDNEQIKNQKPLSEIERILIDKGITIPLSKIHKIDSTDTISSNKTDSSLLKTSSSDLGVEVDGEINQNKSNLDTTKIKEVSTNIENKTTPTNTSSIQVSIPPLLETDTKVEIKIDLPSTTKPVTSNETIDSKNNNITQIDNTIKDSVSQNNKETILNDNKIIVQSTDIQSSNTKQVKGDINTIVTPVIQVENIDNVSQSISNEEKIQQKPIDSGVVSTTPSTVAKSSLFDELTSINPISNNLPTQNKNIDTSIPTTITTPVISTQDTIISDNSIDAQIPQVVQIKPNQEVKSKVEIPLDSKLSTATPIVTDSNLSSPISGDKTIAEPTNKQLAGEKFVKLNSDDLGKKLDIKIEEPKVANQPQPTTKPQNSLLDKLIEDSLKISKAETPLSNVEVKKSEMLLDEVKIKDTQVKSDLMENMYKSSVSKNISIAAMHNVTMAKDIAKNASSVTDVQKSSDMLGLNLESIQKVSDQEMSDATTENKKDTSSQVNRAFLEKNISKQDILVKNDTQILDDSKKVVSTQEIKTNTNNATQKIVEVVISDAEVLTIQNRIIGARQQLGSMMSSVAKAMYENYKPPHTAFKIFLNPANLGQIAILIRSQRSDNSLSISMNMSNSSTLESVVANQNELRNALSKTFDDKHTFELDFKLDSDSSSNSNNSSFENTQQEQQNNTTNDRETFEDIPTSQEQKNGTYF